MRKSFFSFLVGLLILMPILSQATQYDYSDAPSYYGVAYHDTGYWQRLGPIWNSEYSPRYTNLDRSDDGVSWSTDNGATFNNGKVQAGMKVIFRYDFHRILEGEHKYDQLKAWVDWDQDGYFSNINELITLYQWFKNEDPNITEKYFYTILWVPDYVTAGNIWLRARVSCDHVAFANTTPYGELWQGEVEDWKLCSTNVPEPSSILLLSLGLIGIKFTKRKQ